MTSYIDPFFSNLIIDYNRENFSNGLDDSLNQNIDNNSYDLESSRNDFTNKENDLGDNFLFNLNQEKIFEDEKDNVNEYQISESKVKTCDVSKKMVGKKTKRSEETDGKEGGNSNTTSKKARGRKKKDDIEKDKDSHNKKSEDNIMRKIKAKFTDKVHKDLNSLLDEDHQLLKLDSEINKNLKKDYNMTLMGRYLKELYYNTPISDKYRSQAKKYPNKNKSILDYIYQNKEENCDAIRILDSTYIQLFNEIIGNDSELNKILDNIREEEGKKGESETETEEYINSVKGLFLNFEKWFEDKIGRNRGKNDSNESKKKNKSLDLLSKLVN